MRSAVLLHLDGEIKPFPPAAQTQRKIAKLIAGTNETMAQSSDLMAEGHEVDQALKIVGKQA